MNNCTYCLHWPWSIITQALTWNWSIIKSIIKYRGWASPHHISCWLLLCSVENVMIWTMKQWRSKIKSKRETEKLSSWSSRGCWWVVVAGGWPWIETINHRHNRDHMNSEGCLFSLFEFWMNAFPHLFYNLMLQLTFTTCIYKLLAIPSTRENSRTPQCGITTQERLYIKNI